jgi:hypothetical protein
MNPAVITVFTTWEYGKVGRASSVLDQMMDMLGLMRHEQQHGGMEVYWILCVPQHRHLLLPTQTPVSISLSSSSTLGSVGVTTYMADRN